MKRYALVLLIVFSTVAAPLARAQRSNVERMRIRLLSPLGTRENREGDRFTAQVVSPDDLRDAYVEGHIERIRASGRVSGRSEIVLAFDNLVFPDTREEPISARVESIENRDNVEVDAEGRVQGKTTQKRDVLIVAGGTGLGAAIGAAIGGRKGAAIGGAIGAAAGATSVLSTKGPDLDFPDGTEMTIRVQR